MTPTLQSVFIIAVAIALIYGAGFLPAGTAALSGLWFVLRIALAIAAVVWVVRIASAGGP